jgi:hypothetical protein
MFIYRLIALKQFIQFVKIGSQTRNIPKIPINPGEASQILVLVMLKWSQLKT